MPSKQDLEACARARQLLTKENEVLKLQLLTAQRQVVSMGDELVRAWDLVNAYREALEECDARVSQLSGD